jgi:hypothetical protein
LRRRSSPARRHGAAPALTPDDRADLVHHQPRLPPSPRPWPGSRRIV